MNVSGRTSAGGDASRLLRYGQAVLCVGVALAVGLVVDPLVGPGQVVSLFALGIVVAARFGGRAPGLLATGLSVPIVAYFFIEPKHTFAIASATDVFNLGMLIIAGTVISLLVGQPAPSAADAPVFRSDRHFTRRAALWGIPILVLLILTQMGYSGLAREKEREQQVIHSYQVLNAIQALLSNLQDAETGQRGFLLTGEERYAEPFESAVREGQIARDRLRRLTADNPALQAFMNAIGRLTEAKFAELRQTMNLRRSEGIDAAQTLVRSGEGKRIMDEYRAVVRAMEAEDRRLLAERTQASEAAAMRMRWVLGVGSGGLLMLLIVAGVLVERESRSRERARLAANASEQRLRIALDAAEAGAWEWDVETGRNVWSDQLWKLYGLEPNSCEPSYEVWRELVHPEDLSRAEQVVRAAAQNKTELNLEFRLHDRGGRERWLLSRGRPLRNGDARECFVGIVMDISARRQAEAAVHAREQTLRDLVEFAPVAIAMFDHEMRYMAASRRYREDYASGRELAGLAHYEVFPETSEAWREVHRRCLAGATERNPGERFPRADGSEQWVRWEIQPWRQADGAIGGIVLFSEDITQLRRSGQALRDSEARLRLALQAARIGAFEWNIRTGLNTWAPELEVMYGLEPGEFAASRRAWEDLLHPDDRAEAVRQLERALETGFFESEFRIVRPDGAVRRLAGRSVVLKDESGKPQRMIGVNIDVTEAKLAGEMLQRTEAELRNAQQVTRLGSWIYDPQTDRITASEELYRICGLDPEQPFPEFRTQHRMFTPESWKLVQPAVEAAVSAGTAYELDVEWIRPDGAHVWATQRGEAVRDDAGKITGLRGTLQDITRRKVAEEALREAYEQRQLALEAGELGAWDLRFRTGDVFWDDRCRNMFGVPDGSRIAYDQAIALILSEDAPAVRAAVDRALTGADGGAFHQEYRILRPDGAVRWISSHGRAYFEEQGGARPVRFIGVNTDITVRKEAELEILRLNSQLEERVRQRTAQIEAANKELEAFTYSVSHDLRGPLRHVGAFLELLRNHIGGSLDDKGRHYLDTVLSAARQMGTLIDDLLRFSRTGRVEMRETQIDATALVRQTQQELVAGLKDRHIIWRLEPLPEVYADSALLKQVFINLLDNAIKYTRTRPAPEIEVGCRDAGVEWIFFVRDNGVGFDMRYVHKLFGVFQRLHSSADFEGTGIGLANVRRIVGRHGGRTWAESAPDRGSTFYFSLPKGAARTNDEGAMDQVATRDREER